MMLWHDIALLSLGLVVGFLSGARYIALKIQSRYREEKRCVEKIVEGLLENGHAGAALFVDKNFHPNNREQ